MEIVEIIKESGRQKRLLYIKAREKDGSIEPREVEPYSFRHKKSGTLFYGWDVVKNQIRSFRVDRIIEVKITEKEFTPRFPIEF
ncbi:MAG: WYL domain-containing protein [archaeon]